MVQPLCIREFQFVITLRLIQKSLLLELRPVLDLRASLLLSHLLIEHVILLRVDTNLVCRPRGVLALRMVESLLFVHLVKKRICCLFHI
jgi:hypothetical protein